MPSRLVRIPVQRQLEVLARHVRTLQDHRSVLVITSHHTATELRDAFRSHGVDLKRLFIIDAIGSNAGARVSDDPDHLMYVSTPNQLELIALRALKVIQAKAERTAHILVCTANSFAMHNDTPALSEMVRHILRHLLPPKATLEILLEGRPLDPALRDFLAAELDETVDLEPSGEIKAASAT